MDHSQHSDSSNGTAPFFLFHKSRVGSELLAVVLLALILVVFRWQAILHIAQAYIGGTQGDGGLYVWLTRSNVRDLFHSPWYWTEAFYPYGGSLAWSDNFILPSFFCGLFGYLGFSHVVSYNLVMLLAGLLNGYFVFALVFLLGGCFGPALFSGAVFMTTSSLTAHLGHPQLQFVFFIPWMLIQLFRFMENPRWQKATPIGLLVWASFLCGIYDCLFGVLAIGAVLLLVLAIRPGALSLKECGKLALGSLVGFLPTIPFLWPYLSTQDVFGARFLHEPYYFSASVLSYFSAPERSFLYGVSAKLSHSEAQFWFGAVVSVLGLAAFLRLVKTKYCRKQSICFLSMLLLATVASVPALKEYSTERGFISSEVVLNYICAMASWLSLISFVFLVRKIAALESKLGIVYFTNRSILSVFFGLALLFYVVSFGPLGFRDLQWGALGVFSFLFEFVPGWGSIRAVGRCGLVVVLALMVVAGLIQSRLGKGRLSTLLITALLVVALAENVVREYALDPIPPAPPVFASLAKDSSCTDALIVLPLTEAVNYKGEVKSWGDYAIKNVNAMNWAFPLQRPIANGFSGQRTKLMKELPLQLVNFPDLRSVQNLNSIAGLRYVVFVSELVPGFEANKFKAQLKSLTSELNLLEVDKEGNYLLELIGQRDLLGRGFQLMAPPGRDLLLQVDLMAPYEKDAPPISLKVFVLDGQVQKGIASLDLRANGAWETKVMALPKLADGVRPLRLIFSSNRDDTQVFAKQTRIIDMNRCCGRVDLW